jgi:hypothetical protein
MYQAQYTSYVYIHHVYMLDISQYLIWRAATMAIPGLSFAASCNSRSSHEFPVKSVITFYINDSFPTQTMQPPLPDRPCAQHLQSTRRMSLTVKRPSN